MSGPFGSQQWMYASGGFYPYEIDNSVRLYSNTEFTKTFASSGNRKEFTFSCWLKKSENARQGIFGAGTNDTNNFMLWFTSSGRLQVKGVSSGSTVFNYQSTQRHRDPSAWYHIVLSVDTTSSTSSDRVRLYVNGERITDFETASAPSQDINMPSVNRDRFHAIGADPRIGEANFFHGYMAEINFIDGQSLEPTSFGETKSDVWIPKEYTGSYGTNGFYLDFATRATDPIDASGNGNNWSSTNVVSTDWMPDSPTNNFATINSLIERWAVTTNTYTEGNLKVASSGTSAYQFATMQADKLYFEMLVTANNVYPHISIQEIDLQSELGSYAMFYGVNGSSRIGSVDQTIATYGVGDIVALAYDHYGGEGRIYKNGTLLRTTTSQNFDSYMETYLAGGILAAGDGAIFNFGQDSSFAGNKTAQGNTDSNGRGDFYYSPPDGFLAICSANLSNPVATVDPALNANPQDYFNSVLYTGNAPSTQSITGVGFEPDMVWTKSRSIVGTHGLHDIMRLTSSAPNILYPDLTNAEYTASGGGLTSFDSDGFTLTNNNISNTSGATYVAWNWKFGGTGVSNTVGSLTSTVSANQELGISIVTFTADGTSSTVGTGLSSSAPLDMVIIKRRDSTSDWQVGHRASGQSTNFAYHTNLNDTSALSGISPFNLGTSSTTQGHYLQLGAGSYGVSSSTWVAYCFQEVEGFSKFSRYIGNGSTDGPFVYCGFRPAFVMIKNISTAGPYWNIIDSAREPYNVTDSPLFANTSSAESANSAYETDLTSNGFKIRNTNNSHNTSGDTYIFMAFAEMPFKYANAR